MYRAFCAQNIYNHSRSFFFAQRCGCQKEKMLKCGNFFLDIFKIRKNFFVFYDLIVYLGYLFFRW